MRTTTGDRRDDVCVCVCVCVCWGGGVGGGMGERERERERGGGACHQQLRLDTWRVGWVGRVRGGGEGGEEAEV